MQSWPSGLRRYVQVVISAEAWVQILQAALVLLYIIIFLKQVLPGFEPGLKGSEPLVITITPQDHRVYKQYYIILILY